MAHVGVYACANNTKYSHHIKLERQNDTLGWYVLIQNRNFICKVVGTLFFSNQCMCSFTQCTGAKNSASDQAPDCLSYVQKSSNSHFYFYNNIF